MASRLASRPDLEEDTETGPKRWDFAVEIEGHV